MGDIIAINENRVPESGGPNQATEDRGDEITCSEGLELLTAYRAIKSAETRRTIRAYVCGVAESEG